MSKQKKEKPNCDGITFASNEELYFYYWIKEALEKGLIESFEYQPASYTLSEKVVTLKKEYLKTKVKIKKVHLLHPHIYTADFLIRINEIQATENKLFGLIGMNYEKEYHSEFLIDVKGEFNRNNGDREFSINQKWLVKEHNVFVNKVIPEKFFKKNWIPKKIRRYNLRTSEPLKRWKGCLTYQEQKNAGI